MAARYLSGVINIGDLPMGGTFPVRIQSMTNTDTNDIDATVAQTMQLVNAGCEIVRITAQGVKEAANLAIIKQKLAQKGYHVPLVADIHFNPKAAEVAASVVEKVRINPGNYVSKPLQSNNYTSRLYELELEQIAEKLKPLLDICRQHGTAVRIGVNHGSLGSRIIHRYGDTPLGMVESALEFARICRAENFSNLVFSLKSSNVRVMVEATRLLAGSLQSEGMNFPLHLGVTEAGDGEDGIIKSAIGIGALLSEGIGDTIRVSLTGDPVPEIPVARAIAGMFSKDGLRAEIPSDIDISTLASTKGRSFEIHGIGAGNPVGVMVNKEGKTFLVDETGHDVSEFTKEELQRCALIEANHKLPGDFQEAFSASKAIILKYRAETPDNLEFNVAAAIKTGRFLLQDFGDALWLQNSSVHPEKLTQTAFGILQASRVRITRTEFISCPSCGRTLFDIGSKLSEIRAATGHLKGLKIAVMGCIVNGPGEMADADYGYVGAGPGRVTLYKGKTVVAKNIDHHQALDALINLIKASGDWKQPDDTSL